MHLRSNRIPALLSLVLFGASALADPATGWLQTGAGPYDYNDTANWVNGEINGVFGSDLTLTANQTITFSQDTTLTDGLHFQYAGTYSITLENDGEVDLDEEAITGETLPVAQSGQ